MLMAPTHTRPVTACLKMLVSTISSFQRTSVGVPTAIDSSDAGPRLTGLPRRDDTALQHHAAVPSVAVAAQHHAPAVSRRGEEALGLVVQQPRFDDGRAALVREDQRRAQRLVARARDKTAYL